MRQERLIKNKARITLLIIITILLSTALLTGCERRTSAFDQNYRQGRSGIDLELQPGSPPTEIYEGETIPLLLLLKNKGAYSVNLSYVYVNIKADRAYVDYNDNNLLLSGLEKYFKKNNKELGVLHGRSYYFPDGEEALVSAYATAKTVGPFSHIKTPITIEACYPYETIFSTPVCIDTNPLTIAQRKEVCEVKPVMTFRDQGAPLAVTKIEYKQKFNRVQGVGADKVETLITPMFRITITNVGKGVVITDPPTKYFTLKNINDKNPSQETDLNIVNYMVSYSDDDDQGTEPPITPESVERLCQLKDIPVSEVGRFSIIAMLGTTLLKCEPEKPYLKGTSVTVNCYLDLKDANYKTYNYLDELQIRLRYLYRNTVTKEINIIPNEDNNYYADYYEDQGGEDKLVGGLSLCEYCSRNPSDAKCKNLPEESRKKIESGVRFSCTCGRDECYKRVISGSCIVGSSWCTGTNYCCAEDSTENLNK